MLSYFMYFTVSLTTCIFLKFALQDPRPYWVSRSISTVKCNIDFGKPSGHAMIGFIAYFGLYNILINKDKDSKLFRYTMLSVCVWLYANMCFSRIYFGAHSINQVILGFLLGTNAMHLYFICLHEKVK